MEHDRIAVIPARAGSKGLKDKNIAGLCGRPLMSYSISAGIDSGCFSRVIVTTDSEIYAEIARGCGAEVMMRGETLSADNVPTSAVIEDVLCRCRFVPDYFVLLQPTSPLRNARHVRDAVSMFEENYHRFDFLVSVKEAEYAGILVRPIDTDGSLKYFDTDFSSYRRQCFKEYSPNGAIFIGKSIEYSKQKHFFGSRAAAYIMDKRDSVDIDDEFDLQVAEMRMRQKKERHRNKVAERIDID